MATYECRNISIFSDSIRFYIETINNTQKEKKIIRNKIEKLLSSGIKIILLQSSHFVMKSYDFYKSKWSDLEPKPA